MTADWIAWAQRLQALAQNGLTFCHDPYDRDRYVEIRDLASHMMAALSDATPDNLNALFAREDGYMTPKVDVRAAVFRDDRILLVHELQDGLWTLPGGWADVGDTPSEAVEREVWEEAGYRVRAEKLLAVYDRNRQGHPPMPFAIYKLFFLCQIQVGGEHEVRDSASAAHNETTDADFYALDALPPLSVGRVTAAQIARLFEHRQHPEWPTDFD